MHPAAGFFQKRVTVGKNCRKVLDKDPCQWYSNDKYICQDDMETCQKLGGGVKEMPLLNRLREYRARLGINQQELGKLVGASRQTISSIERGDYSPSIVLALKIAKVCEASVEELFQYEEDEEDEREKEET